MIGHLQSENCFDQKGYHSHERVISSSDKFKTEGVVGNYTEHQVGEGNPLGGLLNSAGHGAEHFLEV